MVSRIIYLPKEYKDVLHVFCMNRKGGHGYGNGYKRS